MTSAPWPPLVRWSLLVGGAQGRNYLVPSGEVVLAGNVAPIAEARRLLRQPQEPELAPPVSGRRSPQLATPRVGLSETAVTLTRSSPHVLELLKNARSGN
jgi:hypothetical protein